MCGITLLKHEPSAQSPWQKTMLGLVCVDFAVIASLFAEGEPNCDSFHASDSPIGAFREVKEVIGEPPEWATASGDGIGMHKDDGIDGVQIIRRTAPGQGLPR